MNNTATEQLELTMRHQIRNSYRNTRMNRLKQARWWFAKMRAAVDRALPPQRVAPRPTQTYIRMTQTDLLTPDQQ